MQPCAEVIPGSATGAAGAAKPAPAEQVENGQGLLTVPLVIANFAKFWGCLLLDLVRAGWGG